MEVKTQTSKKSATEDFSKMLEADLKTRSFKEGSIVKATVSEIGKKFILVETGLKAEGAIPIEEFKISKELEKFIRGKGKKDILDDFDDVVVFGDQNHVRALQFQDDVVVRDQKQVRAHQVHEDVVVCDQKQVCAQQVLEDGVLCNQKQVQTNETI